MHVCIFHKCSECAVLKVKNCPDKCKFYKTEEQFIDGQLKAKYRLQQKGLEPCLKHLSSGQVIMSTRRINK